jgi:hypothetical protein
VEYKGSGTAVEKLQNITMADYLNDKTTIRTSGAVSFYREGKLHRAALLSLSQCGARFISCSVVAQKIVEGRAGEYYFQTAYGKSKCRGITRNIFRSDPVIVWEIEFIELSGNEEDPLRRALGDALKKKVPNRPVGRHRPVGLAVY